MARATNKIEARIRIVLWKLRKFVNASHSWPRGKTAPNFFEQLTSNNRKENPSHRSTKRSNSERQCTLTLEPMSDNDKYWAENHTTTDSDSETLA